MSRTSRVYFTGDPRIQSMGSGAAARALRLLAVLGPFGLGLLPASGCGGSSAPPPEVQQQNIDDELAASKRAAEKPVKAKPAGP